MTLWWQLLQRVATFFIFSLDKLLFIGYTLGMDKIQTVLDTLQVKLQQQAFDVSVLALWSHAKIHTRLTDEDIRAFTFRSEYLTPEEAKKNSVARYSRRPPVYCDKNWHNALRLHNDRVVSMPGIARPIPPEWTPTQLQVKL